MQLPAGGALCLYSGVEVFFQICTQSSDWSEILTHGDGVDLAFDLQGAVVALEGVHHLLELCVADHQILRSLLVLLHSRKHSEKEEEEDEDAGKLGQNTAANIRPPTHHFPLFPLQLQHRGQLADRGRRRSRLAGGAIGFGPRADRASVTPQTRVLVGLLIVADVFQT